MAIGIPVATNVTHVRDAPPAAERLPVGRLVPDVTYSLNIYDMEEVD